MCLCRQPTVNGQPGAPPHCPPELREGDELILSEPGRCGGIDAHCVDFAIVRAPWVHHPILLARNVETERYTLNDYGRLETLLLGLDSDARFWLLHTIWTTLKSHIATVKEQTEREWQLAFLRKQIRRRKRRGNIYVWIDRWPPETQSASKTDNTPMAVCSGSPSGK